MPKYLVEGSYTDEGLKGLIKDKASGRAAAIQKAAQSLGGKMAEIYYTFGDTDLIVILDDATVRRIVAAAYNYDRALGVMTEVAATTGARLSQLARLEVADLQSDGP